MVGVLVLCAAWSHAAELPFVESFNARTPGSLDGQGGWVADPATGVQVQHAKVFADDRAASVTNAVFAQSFSNNLATNVWIDFYAQPCRRALPPNPAADSRSAVAFYVNTNGYVVALSNSTWVTFPSYTVSETNWTRFSLHLDYAASNWSIHVCGSASNAPATRLASGLAFQSSSTNTYLTQFSVTATNAPGLGGLMPPGYLDEFTAAIHTDSGVPRSIDADGDMLSDRWETEVFGDTVTSSGGALDSDLDGWLDVQEHVAGTDANDGGSFLRVLAVDLAAEGSDDVVVRVAGGGAPGASVYAADAGKRRYQIRASASAAASKGLIASMDNSQTGTNTWTDVNAAASHARRYYEVAVSYGDAGVTNSEEWAMYVQDRPASTRELISVPVNYGSAAANNLNGALGAHLARGLSASANTNDADWIHFTIGGSHKAAYLIDEGSGAYWYDPDTLTTADVPVSAGMPIWVVRRSGAVTRNNAVFSGRSFTAADMSPITFPKANGGWTVFGWPLAQSRVHSRGDASPNQLGFAAVGTGGRVQTSDPTKKGDELWVWEDNTWKGFYSLLGGLGGQWDGRWWDNLKRDFADIELKPGGAYFYRHTTNAPSDFTWTPEVP